MQNTNTPLKLVCFFFLLFPVCDLVAQKIITVAGNSHGNGPGYSKEYNPTPTSYGIATDDAGNVFFSEIDKATVTKVDVDGNTVLVAGNIAEPGFSGDGGLATNARLSGPRGIWVDRYGNIYIADTNNGRIRKIDEAGIITTIAGGGAGGDGGLAVNASLLDPVDVITDSLGNIYISEQGRHKIRKIDKHGVITTFAGNGTAAFSGDSGKAIQASLNQPSGICFDKFGNLLIADTYNRRIRKIDKHGTIYTIAGNGSTGNCQGDNNVPAVSAAIGMPTDVDTDTTGNIFLLGENKCVIQYIKKNGIIGTLASAYNDPYSLAYSKQNNKLYYSSLYEDLCWGYVPNVRYVDFTSLQQEDLLGGNSHTSVFNGDNIQATIANLSNPAGVAFINGNLYFVDVLFYRIRKIDQFGFITTIAGNGAKGTNGFGDGGLAINASFNAPAEITADKEGNIYISDPGDNRIRKINKEGIITTAYNVAAPRGIAFDAKGNLFYSSPPNVYRIDISGRVLTVAGNGSTCWTEEDSVRATKTCLNYPVGVFIDEAGNLYIADKGAGKIRKVDTTGIITTIAGNTWYSGYSGDNIPATSAWLNNPTGITKDKYGNLIITDNGNHRIRKIDVNGIIHTIAGGGSGDASNCDGEWFDDGTYSGDGGDALGSNLNYPYNVALDKNGNYFISDQYNNRIREVITNCSLKPSPYSMAMKQYINKKFLLQYNCFIIATLTPRLNYLSALNANLITNVWVEKKVVRDSTGKPFVPRHYQVFTETNNNIAATATFTLYFTQSDFDAYNKATNSSYAKLPLSPVDTNGVANIRVYGYTSKSKDGSGLPTSYNTRLVRLNPPHQNIVWNADGKYWEVSFNVSTLGGFFIGTERNMVTANSEQSVTEEEHEILVYPNPAINKVYISLPATLLHKKVQLFNASGKLVKSQIAGAGTISFDIKNLVPGIYLARFENGVVKKVIISNQ